MTKEEFIVYVKAIIDMQPQPAPFYPISPNLNPPYIPSIGVPNTSPDWTYRPEYQPYYTVTCTTNTTQQK